jgi:ribonuclease HI
MPTLEQILESIARLAPADQVELAGRLVARLKQEGLWPARRRPGRGRSAADLVLLYDGGSLGNPGPGYGSFVISLLGGKELHRRLDFRRTMTNNEAEYSTLIAGLEEVCRLLGGEVARATVEVRGDSRLVGQQLQGEWKASNARMRALRDQALELLGRFRDWRFVQVPRREVVRRLGH